MNKAPVRKLATEGFVGLAVCAGLLWGVVEPIERKTADLRATAAEVLRRSQNEHGESPALARAQLARALARAAEVEHAGLPVRSQSEMLATLMRLADEQHVRVEQIEPTVVVHKAPPPPPPASAAPGAAPGTPPPPVAAFKPDSTLGCSLSLVADYAALVAFVDQLERSAGFARVRTLRITPSGEPGSRTVSAGVLSEHVAFDVSGVRTAAGEGAALTAAAQEAKR